MSLLGQVTKRKKQGEVYANTDRAAFWSTQAANAQRVAGNIAPVRGPAVPQLKM